MSYLFVLKKLAYVSFLQYKFAESEKYFKVASSLCPLVSNNPANIFQNKKNLLIYYTHTNLDMALKLGNQMLSDKEEQTPAFSKETQFLLGVWLQFLIF